jgi:L-asparaginase
MKLMECEVLFILLKTLDSSDMGPEEWKMIANYIQKNYHDLTDF